MVILDCLVGTVIRCLVVMKKRVGQRQKEYYCTYGRMVETATKQLSTNFRGIVKHWSSGNVTLQADWLGRAERRKVVIGMSGTATNI